MKKPKITKYIFIAIGIFFFSIFVSAGVAITLDLLDLINAPTTVAELLTNMIEGAVGAIAAGFVLYQLAGEAMVERRENELQEDVFYQHFISYWLETDKLFIDHPECRKFFYSEEPQEASLKNELNALKKEDPDTYQRVMGIAEYLDDLCRYSETEVNRQSKRSSMIPSDQIVSYRKYIKTLRKSCAFSYFRDKYGATVNATEDNTAKEFSDVLSTLIEAYNAQIAGHVALMIGEEAIYFTTPPTASSLEPLIDFVIKRYGCVTLAVSFSDYQKICGKKVSCEGNSLKLTNHDSAIEPLHKIVGQHIIEITHNSKEFLVYIERYRFLHIKALLSSSNVHKFPS